MKLLLFGILLAVCGAVVSNTLHSKDGWYGLFALLLAGGGLTLGLVGLFSKADGS